MRKQENINCVTEEAGVYTLRYTINSEFIHTKQRNQWITCLFSHWYDLLVSVYTIKAMATKHVFFFLVIGKQTGYQVLTP